MKLELFTKISVSLVTKMMEGKVLPAELQSIFDNYFIINENDCTRYGDWKGKEKGRFIFTNAKYWGFMRTKGNFEPHIWDIDCECIFEMYKLFKKILLEYTGIEEEKIVKGMSFYTFVPMERLTYCAENIDRMRKFGETMCEVRGNKYFNQVWYVVESGKYKDNPNIHIHLLCDFWFKNGSNKGSKLFLRDCKHIWKKIFFEDKYTCEWMTPQGTGINRKDCNTLEIQEDKVNYMDNSSKGAHENFTDLGIRNFIDWRDFEV